MRFLTLFALAALSLAAADPKPQVLLIGVYHLGGSTDVIAAQPRDMKSAQGRAEIDAVLQKLAAFRPTIVAVESDATDCKSGASYHDLLSGKYQLDTSNERDLLGLQLAQRQHLADIICVDERRVDWDFEKASAWMKAHRQEAKMQSALDAAGQSMARVESLQSTGGVLAALRYLNSPEGLYDRQKFELEAATWGDAETPIGADLTASWYHRNLRIYANLMRAIHSPQDRVIVIIGQGHAAILKHMFEYSPSVQLVDPLSILGKP